MNNATFQQARLAYNNKDYQTALATFSQCLEDEMTPPVPGEIGLLFHQIGNCLVKIGDSSEAIYAYTQSNADPAYDMKGTVNYNLGMAYAALHDFENAINYFQAATDDSTYEAPFKAYLGMGNAMMRLGKTAEAGVAFRQAALDERNPDPTKALVNLGICFMALNRPADAIASYESALPFNMVAATRNKLYANLGQAYVAAGKMQEAVDAFEKAMEDKSYLLNDSASVDYQTAVAALSGRNSLSGSLEPVNADMSGLDVLTEPTPGYTGPIYPDNDPNDPGDDPYYYPENYENPDDGYESGDDRFFNASDEELEQWSKGVAKQQRKHRNTGLKIMIALIVLLLLVLGAAVFGYTQGYGWPTQEAVIEELFNDPQAASEKLFVESGAGTEEVVNQIVSDNNVKIDGMNKSMTETTAYVTAKTAEGADVQYKIVLVRDMITWQISQVELYFPSQN